ncbi:hypothetical protein BK666_20725 [Pseudomonas frederiksbergensis]|uniref:Uncharacterized protein n=1 Tax=Pseudomonas frederiksbergensis TaxID=104087 RepID=A0A423JZY4_9PSED|nr:hypothetical protein [Pseudomonas frederiksbergensis]RON43500.1 hypothetical protein BK666_20725 [Pseudomonas frederiksbergensis]
MSLYLYLNEYWHADTWVGGGKIPINPASTYKSMERAGIFTPDENLIHKSEVDLTTLGPFLSVGPGSVIKDLTFEGCIVDDEPFPDITNADYYEDDGLILSFSSRLTGGLARKMKKKSCVKILSMGRLKAHLDEQLGVESLAKFCKYTSTHERNHFLKSDLDEWQAEFRLFWPILKKVEVLIPAGTAELICTW